MLVDSNKTSEDDIEEYKELFGNNIGYILLNDKIVTLNMGNEEETMYTYEEFVLKYFGAQIDWFNKGHILEVIDQNNVGLGLQLAIAIASYTVSWSIAFLMYIIPISIIVYLSLKIYKKPMNLKDIISANFYSYTLAIILQFVHVIQSLYTEIQIPGFEYVILLISAVYMGKYIRANDKTTKQ